MSNKNSNLWLHPVVLERLIKIKKAIANRLNYLRLILKNREDYKYWKLRVAEEPIVDFDRGGGYYITLIGFGPDPKGRIEEIKIKGDKTAICKLIKYSTYRDPSDMIEHGYYQVLGFKGEKLFKDMTFAEYLKSTTELRQNRAKENV